MHFGRNHWISGMKSAASLRWWMQDWNAELSRDEEYLLASEVADAGCVILSRSQLVSETQQKETVAHINRSMELVKCSRRFGQEIMSKDWDHLTDVDFEQIKNSGYVMEDFAKLEFQKEAVFSSLSFLNLQMDEKKLKKIVEQLFASTEAGEVLRVKGFWQQRGTVDGVKCYSPQYDSWSGDGGAAGVDRHRRGFFPGM